MTACVFAWEDKADHSGKLMLSEMNRYIEKYWPK
jgi:myo-inositol catabolism protein IolH